MEAAEGCCDCQGEHCRQQQRLRARSDWPHVEINPLRQVARSRDWAWKDACWAWEEVVYAGQIVGYRRIAARSSYV